MSLSHSACGPSSPGACATGNESAEDADISSLLGMLESVADPRSPQGIQHTLKFVLAASVVAMLAGAKNYREIASHAADIPQPLLKKLGAERSWFTLRYKHPSKSTVRNVLTRVDAAEMDMISGAWLFAQARKNGKAEWIIAVDGKVMRGAWTDENDKVTLFSAMLHREAVTIAQVRVPDQADSKITDRSLGSTLSSRTNLGPTGQDDTAPTAAAGESFSVACPRISAIIRRETFEISGDRISKVHALILTSRKAGRMTAADVSRHTRGHWGIENKSHYIRDTVYREDSSQAWAAEGPHALGSLRNLALGLLRLQNANSIKETTEWICRDRTRALQFMTT